MKRKSILTKMLTGLSLPIVIVLVIASFFILTIVEKSISELTIRSLTSESQSASYQASEFFTVYLKGSQYAASNYYMQKAIEDTSKEIRFKDIEGYNDLKKTLEKIVLNNTENILSSWIASFDSSQAAQSGGFTTEEGWDITKRPWYRVSETKKPVLTEPYIDTSTGNLIITAASPVLDNVTGEAIGAVGFDIKLDKLNDIMSSYKIGKNGFLILCADNNQIIYHPNSDYIEKDISKTNISENVINLVKNKESGYIEYTIDGKNMCGYLSKISDTGWTVLTGITETEFKNSYNKIGIIILIIFGIGLIILVISIIIISKGIIKPLKNLAFSANKIAEGNLNVYVETKSFDEIGQVSQAIHKTVERLKQYIDYINEISNVLRR